MFIQFFRRLKQRRMFRVAAVYAVTGYAIFQIANNLLPALNLPRWTVSLIALLFLVGFPIVLAMAYTLEYSPGGRQADAAGAKPGRLGWFDWALLATTLVIVGVAVAQFSGVRLPTTPAAVPDAAPVKSIAVLPFANFSEFKDGDYFADGLTEELINSLAQLPDLRVAGRTSAFYFKGRNEDLREIGRKLGVAHVLEGSVRRSGENLRITAQLISVADGFHLWSQTFDRAMSDVLTIQSQISTAVAQVLKARLLDPGSGTDTQGTRDPRAYQMELVARSRLRTQELEDLKAARTLFGDLIKLEPDNARAHAGLAEATLSLAQNHLALDFDQARSESEAAIERALALDPSSSDTWRVKGYFNHVLSIRTSQQQYADAALASLRRAVELDPRSSDALAMLAGQLVSSGQREEAIALLRRSLEIDPLSRLAQFLLGSTLASQGRFGEARRQYEGLVALYPDFTNARVALGELLMSQGRLDDAVAALNDPKLISADPQAALLLANCYANLGMQQEMTTLLGSIREPPVAAALAQAVLLQRNGRYNDLGKLAAKEYAVTRDPIWHTASLVSSVFAGDEAAMRAHLPDAVPGLLGGTPAIEEYTELDVLLTAHALRRTGSPEQARRIIDALIEQLTIAPHEFESVERVWLRSLAYASRGDMALSLEELERAQSRGFRLLIDLEYFARIDEYPFMADLAGDPRFLALVNRIELDNERMRAAVSSRTSAPALAAQAR